MIYVTQDNKSIVYSEAIETIDYSKNSIRFQLDVPNWGEIVDYFEMEESCLEMFSYLKHGFMQLHNTQRLLNIDKIKVVKKLEIPSWVPVIIYILESGREIQETFDNQKQLEERFEKLSLINHEYQIVLEGGSK